ncbi:MAG: HD domain-containing protein [Chloroflexi bacterium]|nr:HD domain-containing protein [Chloroflexota bacterium]
MVQVPALQPFLEARSAAAGRAFARPPEQAGLALCHELSDALDESLRSLAGALPPQGVAVVAVGSSGRREQCRHSDIDMMLLFDCQPERWVSEAMLYPLWDSGLQVGHSARTLRQVKPAARDNIQTFTSLLDARLVAGAAALFERFRRGWRKTVRGGRTWMREELAATYEARLAREPWQLQEPNLKTSRGGLRALQLTRWLASAEAIAEGDEPPEPAPELAEARELLLATRNALHSLGDRANDRARRDLLETACERLGVEQREWSERLSAGMRAVDAAAGEALRAAAASSGRRWSGWLQPWRRSAEGDGARPDAAPAHVGRGDLERLVAALREAGPGGPLDPLPGSAWLERLLPEWEVLRNQPHVAPFHRHPVDVHSWRTVSEAMALLESDDEPSVAQPASELDSPRDLLIASLLHDIGKGHEGPHSEVGAVIAEHFADRAGLGDETAGLLAATVRHHLLLPMVATRRDIADERVIRDVAEQVGDVRTLNLLYLVSVADAKACGSDIWNAWTAQLMRSLYTRVREALSDVSLRTAVARRRRAVVQGLSGWVAPRAVETHLDQMPVNYLLSMEPLAIGRHIGLIAEGVLDSPDPGAGRAMTPMLHHDRLGSIDRLTIVTADQPGILQAVAGTLTVHHVNVLGGTAFTRDDGIAVDVMHLGDARGREIDDERWERIREAVPSAIAGEFPIEQRLAETREAYRGEPPAPIPTSVTVDNSGSEDYSILEIRAADRLGLLYAITNVLHEVGLDIHMAKVNTLGHEIVDAFYVRRANGRRIEAADEIERLAAHVTEAVQALDE